MTRKALAPRCQDFTKKGAQCAATASYRVWPAVFGERRTPVERARTVLLVCGTHCNSRVITDGWQFDETLPNPVAVVRNTRHGITKEPLGHRLMLWCPACNRLHQIWFTGPDGVVPKVCWEFDGNIEAPTVSPSLAVSWSNGSAKYLCHSYIKNGQWQFLGDSTHALAGQTVGLVPLPDWLAREVE